MLTCLAQAPTLWPYLESSAAQPAEQLLHLHQTRTLSTTNQPLRGTDDGKAMIPVPIWAYEFDMGKTIFPTAW